MSQSSGTLRGDLRALGRVSGGRSMETPKWKLRAGVFPHVGGFLPVICTDEEKAKKKKPKNARSSISGSDACSRIEQS